MSKDQTYEEALEELTTAKETLSEAKTTKRDFMKENKIKRNTVPDDSKLASKLEKHENAVTKAQEKVDDARETAKGLKPRKVRETKYEYPEGMTDKEKKRFRAKKRREAKGEKEPKKKETKKKLKKKSDSED